MASITSANAILIITIPLVFPVPQQLQGFAADDIYDIAQVKPTETMMGADGKLSGGRVPVPKVQTISFQADAASNDVFHTWNSQQEASGDVYIATGMVLLTAISKKFVQNVGYLTGYKPAPAGKKTLQPSTYEITWETVIPATIA